MTSPTASELNQGKELTEQRVRDLRDRVTGGIMEVDKMYDAGTIVALCDQFLAASRRGEGDGIKRPVRATMRVSGQRWVEDAKQNIICECAKDEHADAIVEALNKNTGGAS